MPLYLAQTTYFKKTDPMAIVWIIAFIVVLISARLIYDVIKGNIKLDKEVTFKKKTEGFSDSGFSRAARQIGLEEDQIRFLKKYGKNLNIQDASFIFKNKVAVHNFLKKVYVEIENSTSSEAEAESNKALLFAVREQIDSNSNRAKPIHSSKEIPDGTPFSFITAGGDHYPSKFFSVESGGLICETPKDSVGTEIRFKRGSKLQCYFYQQGQKGYSFETKVIGYQTQGARTVLLLGHSEHVAQLPNRLHQRRRLITSCSFTKAKIVLVQENGKQTRKPIFDTRSFPGAIGDVSAGGISLKTANPLAENEYLRIDFSVPGDVIEAIGKVVKTNRLQNMGGIMHIQFVKINRKNLNRILSFVYGYDE